MKILIIDSEGLGSFEKNENYDNRIFLLSLMLSSYFIYNSLRQIDENSLNDLYLILNLAENLKKETNESQNPENIIFPEFLWVLRDFMLDLKDFEGNSITSQQYLENSLKSNFKDEKKNKKRTIIKEKLKNRDCETIIRPAENEKDLCRLDQLPNICLREEFLQSIGKLRKKIMSNIKVKKIGKNEVNASIFLNLASEYINSINLGKLPNIRKISESVEKYQMQMELKSFLVNN